MLACFGRKRPSACDLPRGRYRLCHSVRRFRHRSTPVPLRTTVRRLAGPHAAAAFERRQGTAWEDIEDGRQISASASRPPHHLTLPPSPVQPPCPPPLP